MMRCFTLAALGATFTVGIAGSANAAPVPYTTGTAVFTNLGGSTPGDTVTLGSAAGTFDAPGTYTLNNVTFAASRFTPAPTPFTGTFSDTLTTPNGVSSYDVNYSLQLGSNDTITLGGNSFAASGFNLLINPLILTSGPDGTFTGVLAATVTSITAAVPEPATWAMMMVGFGAVGAGLRRRRRPGRLALA